MKTNLYVNPKWQEIIEKIQQMTLMDDIFFNSFMENNKASMEYILNIIMTRYDLKVQSIRTQHTIPNLYGRGVRFDVLATDQYGRVYDFEVQNANSGATPQRARYNSDMLDLIKMNAGDEFTELPETYVIFITAKDVLGYGLPIYHIERYITELNQPFNDKAHIIYVNGENNSDTPLGQLMRDFKQSNPDLIKAKILSDRMKYLKSTNEEVIKMCNIVEEYTAKKVAEATAEVAARSKDEGIRIANLNNIKSIMRNMHLSAEKAMEAIGIEQSQYKQYLALL
ncbi:MAG: PD-(D/E)XK nuclease family transposase [Anaerovibrio sp.]